MRLPIAPIPMTATLLIPGRPITCAPLPLAWR